MSTSLDADYLCEVHIELADDAPLSIGKSPWRNQRLSQITGGQFEGPKLKGTIYPGGADLSESAQMEDGTATTRLDVRSVWQTDDGENIFVSYGGRFVIPAGLLKEFSDPSKLQTIDPNEYYFRINPLFETSSAKYSWLNNKVAIGKGKRTPEGVTYQIYTMR